MYKDLGLAMDVARGAGSNIVPVGDVVHGIYGSLVNDGYVGRSVMTLYPDRF